MRLTLKMADLRALVDQPGYEDLRKIAVSARIREGLTEALSTKQKGALKNDRPISDEDCIAYWLGNPNFGASLVQERYNDRLREEEEKEVKKRGDKKAKDTNTLKLAPA